MMKKLYLLLAIIHLSKGLPVRPDKKSKPLQSSAANSHQRQYVTSTNQPQPLANSGTQMNQYGYNQQNTAQQNGQQYTQQSGQQYGQDYSQQNGQQYGQQYGQQNDGRQATSSGNRGHNGLLYSHRPVPDPNKNISPPDEKKYKKKPRKEDNDDDEE